MSRHEGSSLRRIKFSPADTLVGENRVRSSGRTRTHVARRPTCQQLLQHWVLPALEHTSPFPVVAWSGKPPSFHDQARRTPSRTHKRLVALRHIKALTVRLCELLLKVARQPKVSHRLCSAVPYKRRRSCPPSHSPLAARIVPRCTPRLGASRPTPQATCPEVGLGLELGALPPCSKLPALGGSLTCAERFRTKGRASPHP